MSINTRPSPAKPVVLGQHYSFPVTAGMSLRDYFAGQALAGLCANLNNFPCPTRHFGETAYAIADAMLAERAK